MCDRGVSQLACFMFIPHAVTDKPLRVDRHDPTIFNIHEFTDSLVRFLRSAAKACRLIDMDVNMKTRTEMIEIRWIMALRENHV